MKLSIVKRSVLIGAVLAASVSTAAVAGIFSGDEFKHFGFYSNNTAVNMNPKGSGIRAQEQSFKNRKKDWFTESLKTGSGAKTTPSFDRINSLNALTTTGHGLNLCSICG